MRGVQLKIRKGLLYWGHELFGIISDHFTRVQNQYKESLKTIQDQRKLIGQLEADLTRIRPYLPPRSEAEVGTYSSVVTHDMTQ